MNTENEQFETPRPRIGAESIAQEKFVPNPEKPKRIFNERGMVEWGGEKIADMEFELANATKVRETALQDITEEYPSATVEKYRPAFDAQLEHIETKRAELAHTTKDTITRIINGDVPI